MSGLKRVAWLLLLSRLGHLSTTTSAPIACRYDEAVKLILELDLEKVPGLCQARDLGCLAYHMARNNWSAVTFDQVDPSTGAKSSRDVDVDIISGDCEDAREIPLHKRDKLQEFRSVVVLQRQFKAASTSLTCIASLFGPLTGFVSIRLVHLFLICQYVLTCLAHITIGLS